MPLPISPTLTLLYPPPYPSHTEIAIPPPSLLGTSPPSHLRQTLSPKFPALPHNHCLFLHISLPPSLFYLENCHTLSLFHISASLSHIDQTFPLFKPRTPSQSPYLSQYLSVCMSSGRKVIFSFPLFKIIPTLTRFTLPPLPRNFPRKGKTSYLLSILYLQFPLKGGITELSPCSFVLKRPKRSLSLSQTIYLFPVFPSTLNF